MTTARVLIIAGSDSGGGAGIQADLKTVSALGAYGMTAITALTAQNTTGVYGLSEVPAQFVARQIDVCVQDIGCDAVKIGMLASAGIVEAVADSIRRHGLGNVVVDPVMVAKSGDSLLEPAAVTALTRLLLPLATVVTPNLHEAAALTGRPVRNMAEMEAAAQAIVRLGPQQVVIKGGHLEGAAADLLYDGTEFVPLRGRRYATKNTHGTGCIFSSAIAAGLAMGLDVRASVEQAKKLISAAIRHCLAIGSGYGPADPMAWNRPGRQ